MQKYNRLRILAILIGVSILIVPLTQMKSPTRSQSGSEPAVVHYVHDTSVTTTQSVYFPLIMREFSTWQAPIGTQYYAAMDESTNFELMAEARPGWVRYPVIWSRIEPADTEPENYQWYATLERSIANANDANARVLLTIAGQPEWAADYPMGPVNDEAALFEFVGALVERYDGDGVADAPGSLRVEHFEFHNEPDGTDEYRGSLGTHGYWGYRGTEYGELLHRLYPVVKAANPDAQLIMGGLAMNWFVENGGIFDSEFLDDVLAACEGKTCVDAVNIHYYPVFHNVWEPYGYGIIGKTNYTRQTMAKYGKGDLPIFCTEMGWSGAEETGWGGLELQARYAVQGFVRGLSADVSMMIWFKARDTGYELDYPGLLDANLDPRPSYYAFKTTIQQLQGLEFVRQLTEADTGSPHIEGYSFKDSLGHRVDVLWTMDETRTNPDDNPVVELSVNATELTVIDKLGNEQPVFDGVDGQIDGKVKLQLDGSPLFLRY